MLDNNEVKPVLDLVSQALAEADRADSPPTLSFIDAAFSDKLKIDTLKRKADIKIETPSGPAPRGVGPLIRFGKRVFRRSVRWYVKPTMAQQSAFNASVLEVAERQLAAQERLSTRLAALEERLARLEHASERGPLA